MSLQIAASAPQDSSSQLVAQASKGQTRMSDGLNPALSRYWSGSQCRIRQRICRVRQPYLPARRSPSPRRTHRPPHMRRF